MCMGGGGGGGACHLLPLYISTTLEKVADPTSQATHSCSYYGPVHASDVYRGLGSAFPSFVGFRRFSSTFAHSHDVCTTAACDSRAEWWEKMRQKKNASSGEI